MRRTWGWLAIVAVIVAGCNGEDDMDLKERAEARATQTRALVDDLAAKVGTDPEVRVDQTGPCVPGDDDSGLSSSYLVRVTVEPDAVARLRGEIADDLSADGWTVKRDPDNAGVASVRFAKDSFNLGVKVSEADRVATVGGSGGCVTD